MWIKWNDITPQSFLSWMGNQAENCLFQNRYMGLIILAKKPIIFVCYWVYLMLGLGCCRWWRGWSLRLLRFHLDSHQLTDHSLTDNYYTVVLLAQGGWWQATDKSHDKLILMWKKDVLKETTDISTHNSIISISDSACSVVTKASNIMAFNTHQTITVKEKIEYIFMVSEWNETI